MQRSLAISRLTLIINLETLIMDLEIEWKDFGGSTPCLRIHYPFTAENGFDFLRNRFPLSLKYAVYDGRLEPDGSEIWTLWTRTEKLP